MRSSTKQIRTNFREMLSANNVQKYELLTRPVKQWKGGKKRVDPSLLEKGAHKEHEDALSHDHDIAFENTTINEKGNYCIRQCFGILAHNDNPQCGCIVHSQGNTAFFVAKIRKLFPKLFCCILFIFFCVLIHRLLSI